MPAKPRALHMVGIGGAGMSGLALLAHAAGYRVSGSDRDDSDTLAALREIGIDARAGHGSDRLPERVDALVISTAIADDNPELRLAQERGWPVLHRVDLLAELMNTRRGVAVAGAHGKSTTSGMLATIMADASVCVGATIRGGHGTGARWGDGEWFIAEADESDRSLLKLRPEAACLLNVDLDHHTTFADIGEVEDVFSEFVSALPSDGLLVVGPSERARRIASGAPCAVRILGVDGWADMRPLGPNRYALVRAEGGSVEYSLAVPGDHNGWNAACALALAEWCGGDLDRAAAALANFGGVGRRFELRGERAGIRIVDDYAHHPAEVRATLMAARSLDPGRVVVVFQPHLYSRTRALGPAFSRELRAADLVVITDVYAAREEPDPEVSGRDIVDRVPGAHFVPSLAGVPAALCPELRSGDLVITMGAGDITNLAGSLLSGIEEVQDGRPGDSS